MKPAPRALRHGEATTSRLDRRTARYLLEGDTSDGTAACRRAGRPRGIAASGARTSVIDTRRYGRVRRIGRAWPRGWASSRCSGMSGPSIPSLATRSRASAQSLRVLHDLASWLEGAVPWGARGRLRSAAKGRRFVLLSGRAPLFPRMRGRVFCVARSRIDGPCSIGGPSQAVQNHLAYRSCRKFSPGLGFLKPPFDTWESRRLTSCSRWPPKLRPISRTSMKLKRVLKGLVPLQ